MRSCSVLLRNERVQSQQELVHGVMLGAELLDLGGSKDVWGEHHAQFQTLRLAHVAKVVLHHLLRLGQQQVAEQHLLVDAAGPDERRVELFRMVGRHDDDAVGAVHHAVEHVKQPGEVEPVLLLQQRLESVLLLGRPLLHHRHHLLHLLHPQSTGCCSAHRPGGGTRPCARAEPPRRPCIARGYCPGGSGGGTACAGRPAGGRAVE
mmetsp:Transcript_12152/g.40059  ORF Transcript_12152/g.40059 Transcript_12152/m.40059 type:complete len:206 (+) Transcript_12152:265-882(+)